MQGGNDQFFVVCNRLPELVQLFNAEINVLVLPVSKNFLCSLMIFNTVALFS